MTHVAICIVGFRNVQDVADCLKAVATSTHADFEVVICENGGALAFAELQAAIPRSLPGKQPVTLLAAPDNPGYAGGVNRCMSEAADADAWWILNPDTEPHPEALAHLVARLRADDCDAAGGVLHGADGRVQSCGGRWRRWWARAESIGHGRDLEEPVDVAGVERQLSYLSGASMLVGRSFFARAGRMREDYFLYCEEVEWCLRAARNGARFGLAPQARVQHAQGSTTGSGHGVAKRARLPIYLDERNKILLTRDLSPGPVLAVAALGALLLLVLRYARRGAWTQFGYGCAGWMAGLRNERGKPGWLTS